MEARNTKYSSVVLAFVTLLLSSCAQSSVFYSNRYLVQTYVQSFDVQSMDFLWVIDNSPSMAPKRQYLINNMQSFLDTLNSVKAVDYQMAVTNVDYISTPGALVASNTGLTVVKSGSSTTPAADFGSIVANDIPTATAWWEQGLVQSYMAIQNNGAQFHRSGVPLYVIILSDDDDWSCNHMSNGAPGCFGIQPENNPDIILYDIGFFINFFQSVQSQWNAQVAIFPVVATADADCSIEGVGTRYTAVANALGNTNVIGGLCPDQIGTSLNNIASTLANKGTSFALDKASDGTNISVLVNGQTVPQSSVSGWTFDSATNSVLFHGKSVPPKGATVNISFNQKS